MIRINDEYVSFETAKMLKKVGFDWYTKNHYNHKGDFRYSDNSKDWNAVEYLERYSAPTLSFAARWIREKYNFNISALWDSEKCCYYEFVQKITDKDDLMMLSEKKEGWVNVYKDENNDDEHFTEKVIYKTRKDAFVNACPKGYVKTVKISWEE